MSGAVKSLVFGVTDPAQATEAGHLGVDAVIVAVGESHPAGVPPGRATEIARALPPLALRLAYLVGRVDLPHGFSGAITDGQDERPAGAAIHVARLSQESAGGRERLPDADALWIEPRCEGTSSATRFDYALLERLSRRRPLLLEIPDGAAGVETAIRLGRPYAVVFGEAVWFRPGIIDIDGLEQALSVVTRLNKAAVP